MNIEPSCDPPPRTDQFRGAVRLSNRSTASFSTRKAPGSEICRHSAEADYVALFGVRRYGSPSSSRRCGFGYDIADTARSSAVRYARRLRMLVAKALRSVSSASTVSSHTGSARWFEEAAIARHLKPTCTLGGSRARDTPNNCVDLGGSPALGARRGQYYAQLSRAGNRTQLPQSRGQRASLENHASARARVDGCG